MASSSHSIGPNFRDRIIKGAAVRVSDATSRTTTDYAEIICGDGAPSGAYGRDSSATMLYLRKDASSADAAFYGTVDGGTTWAALQTSAAGGTQADLIFSAATELTIASGAITATQAVHTVDTQSDDPTDDLDTIAGGTAEELLLLRPASAARTVVLKHAIGSNRIACLGARDISLAESTDWALLAYDGTQWICLAASTLADGILAAANTWTGNQSFGVSGTGVDVTFYGDTATRDIVWDQSEDTLRAADNAKIGWGSGAGTTPDIYGYWDATKLVVNQLTANSAIDWGVDGAGIDHVFYGDTASAKVTWDQSADSMVFAGGAKLDLGTSQVLSDYYVRATIAVADATGGTNTAALTVDLFRLDGTTVLGGAKQIMITAVSGANQYQPFVATEASVTFGTATKGSIVGSGGGWCLAETDADGEFDCTVTNTDDETVYFAVQVPGNGQSDTSKGVIGVISNSDAATWSA